MPSRRAPRSPSRSSSTTKQALLILALGWALGCDSTAYDFGQPIGDDTSQADGAVCEDLEDLVVDAGCGAVGVDAGCLGERGVPTVRLGETIGCTPAGLSLGVLALGAGVEYSRVDLYAWAGPGPDGGLLFDESVSLAPFRDPCGDDPVGGELQCGYRPWVVYPQIKVEQEKDALLHVQTVTQRETVPIGFQLQAQEQWDAYLLAPDAVHFTALDRLLADHPPWDGEPQPLDLTRKAPALNGTPWMCGSDSAGWRQAAYLLQNATDNDRQLTRVQLLDGVTAEHLPFHFAFYRVLATEKIDPAQSPLASSCHDAVNHSSKHIDLLIEKWVPELPHTQYALVLQVPPTVGPSVQLILDSETALETTEKH